MPTYVVERHLPGIGRRSRDELQATAKRLQAGAEQLDSGVEWVKSYVSENIMYCVLSAPTSDLIRVHGRRIGFPADQISEINEILEPIGD